MLTLETTRRFYIELPVDLAEAVSARVASGQYGSASEVVQEGLRLLDEQRDPASDEAVEGWLRTEVVAAYDEWTSNPAGGLTIDEVRSQLKEARGRRQAGA